MAQGKFVPVRAGKPFLRERALLTFGCCARRVPYDAWAPSEVGVASEGPIIVGRDSDTLSILYDSKANPSCEFRCYFAPTRRVSKRRLQFANP